MRFSIVIATCMLAGTAAAEPVVLAVSGADIFVDLGARDGVGAGTELELLHEVEVRDPSTGQRLRDHFALGTLGVTRSGDRISIARAEPALAKRVLAGDRVRVVSAPRTFRDPWQERVAASRPAAIAPPPPDPDKPSVDHAGLARTVWQATLGLLPEQRIERWMEFLRTTPDTPYRPVVEREVASLRAQITARDAALASARSVDDRPARIARLVTEIEGHAPLVVAPLSRVVPGQPIQLAFLVRDPKLLVRQALYVRAPGDPGFRRIPLVPDGDSYLRESIDAGLVRSPNVAWYIDSVLGSAEEPEIIAIDPAVEEAAIAAGRSHIDAHVDYVDFDGKLGGGFDQYYQAEIDFTYRFLSPVHAVRLGFGTLSGKGGPKDVIDADPSNRCLDTTGTFRCRAVDFSYVYTEFEFRLRPSIAVMLRPQAGLLSTDRVADARPDRCSGADTEGCESATGFGVRARVRLGEEFGTNLVLGLGVTENIGTLLEASYHWLPTRAVPVQLAVHVTDLPVPEDFGVRLIGDVGWRATTWFYPSVRVSYQARDIDHGGISGGLALNFDW